MDCHYNEIIRNNPLLRPEEETALAKRKDAGDQSARDRLILSNIRLVFGPANKYAQKYNYSLEDLIQAGIIKLTEVVDKFDWRQGTRLSSYAVPAIDKALKRESANNGRTIRLPAHIITQESEFRKAVASLSDQFGRMPAISEISTAMVLDEREIGEIINQGGSILSLDSPVLDDKKGQRVDFIKDDDSPDPEEEAWKKTVRETLMKAVADLSPKEQFVFTARNGLNGKPPISLAKIGRALSVTRARVQQVEAKAKQKIRRDPHLRSVAAEI